MAARRQEPPRYYGYWRYYGGMYARVNACADCGTVSLDEDAPNTRPCRHCGGRVRADGVAKWVPPVYKRKWLIFKELVTDGYWHRPGA